MVRGFFRRAAPNWAVALVVLCFWWAWPRQAWAAGGLSHEAYQQILLLLGLVGVAYIITHSLFEAVARRFGFVSGVEYILIGALVGPMLGVMDKEALVYFSPAIELGTGAVGLLAGLQVNPRGALRSGLEPMRHARWVALATLLLVVVVPGAAIVALGYWLDLWLCQRVTEELALYAASQLDCAAATLAAGADSISCHAAGAAQAAPMACLPTQAGELLLYLSPGLFCVGAVAMVADSGPLYSLTRFLDARGPASLTAIEVARLVSALAIAGFGFIFCLSHAGDTLFLLPQYAFLEWFVIHVAIGGVLGVIFGLYLRGDLGEEQLLTVVLGMVIFSSGLAFYLQLSPIFVNFVLGLVLGMMQRGAVLVEEKLVRFERPLYIVLFFFAGASFPLEGMWWWAPFLVVPYLILRHGGRWLGSVVAVRLSSGEERMPPLGRVLLVPGGLSVAMLLDFHQVFARLNYEASVYGLVLLGIVLSEFVAHRRARSWLIDATDVDPAKIRRASTLRAGGPKAVELEELGEGGEELVSTSGKGE